ncbi:metallophosphoesterase [Pedobacter sp. MC2016-15]|uniref:metallophosphoesterase n=1 Tax=Pedobacter sp. MC2016-15 TaxID=2994473 RepID=UPI00224557C4|nr:metallophosphoesterase [Pedobacter sp. MC2016-15]MCX2477520.1 metallophosphoesterase [Pedobacter sp. MC2016-15]
MKRLLPIAIILFIIFLLNCYVLSGVLTLSSNPYITPVFWTAIAAIAGAVMYGFSRLATHGLDWFMKIAFHIALTLVVAEILMAAMLLLGDTYDLIAGVPRNIYWVEACFLLMLLTIFLFVYGMIFGKYNYKVIRHTLYFDNLPDSFDGFKLVQISDVHAGSLNNPKAIQRGISLINAQKADLFVFTGDLVNNKAEEIKPWLSYFSQIKAPYGQFSVLGNHDYGDYIKWDTAGDEKGKNLAQLKTYHQELGFRLLLDEHVHLNKNNEHIVLAGVENWGIGFGERGDLRKAMAGTTADEFKILLSHDPTHWEAQVKNFVPKIQLTLAGHTHGMQFGLEAFGIKWSPVKYRYKHWAGIKTENDSVININRGFGFIGFSGRIGIWPEITVIELKKKA